MAWQYIEEAVEEFVGNHKDKVSDDIKMLSDQKIDCSGSLRKFDLLLRNNTVDYTGFSDTQRRINEKTKYLFMTQLMDYLRQLRNTVAHNYITQEEFARLLASKKYIRNGTELQYKFESEIQGFTEGHLSIEDSYDSDAEYFKGKLIDLLAVIQEVKWDCESLGEYRSGMPNTLKSAPDTDDYAQRQPGPTTRRGHGHHR